jgi:RNA polymerase sigma-70 factor (ECF subfamily)
MPAHVIADAISGDAAAISQIFLATCTPLRTYVVYRLGSQSSREADDIVSETYVRMIRHLPTYVDTGRDIMAWLYTIARNILLDLRKSARWNAEQLTSEWVDDMAAIAPEPDTIAIESLHRAQRSKELRKYLNQITDSQAAVLRYRYFSEMSTEHTAQALDMSTGQVKALQNRGLHAMARHYGVERKPLIRQRRRA